MKKNNVIAASLLGIGLFCVSCSSQSMKDTKNLKINKVDITKIADGNYSGSYSYARFTYKVEVTVKDKQIEKITVLENRKSKFAKKAEGVLDRIVAEQNNDVEVVSGATTTSKAFLKAVENALSK